MSSRTLVFALALVATLVAPCLCVAAPLFRGDVDPHACCPSPGETVKAADPGCCDCAVSGPERSVYERSASPGLDVPAAAGFVPAMAPPPAMAAVALPAPARAYSPPFALLRV